jgi:hypothetical protein
MRMTIVLNFFIMSECKWLSILSVVINICACHEGKWYDILFPYAQQSPVGQGLLIHEVLDHTQLRTTVGRTTLNE